MAKNEPSKGKSKSKLPLYISIVIGAGVVTAYFSVPQVKAFLDKAWEVLTSDDERLIKDWVSDFGWMGPLVLVLAMIVQMFLIIVPTILLMVVTVLAYGPYWGSLIIFVSVYAASSIGYLIGSYLSDGVVVKLLGKKTLDTLETFIDQFGFWAVIVTRLNPFLSNDAISFVGGILKMGYWRFIGATLLGILPLTIFIAIMGKTTDSLKTGLLWGSVGSLLVFLAYVWWRKKKSKEN